MSKRPDELGDRMKSYEGQETMRRFLPMLPIYARIDGRGFSKFTKGMERPFDPRMTDAMIETTKYLVKETHAEIGYVQSDEISLVWHQPDPFASIFFDGRISKLTSVLASMTTAAFSRQIRGWQPYEDRFPHFDARVLQLPVPYEATNMMLWRSIDATKNAVSMACRHYYSAKQMHGKSQGEMIEMLQDRGVTFGDYPAAFRMGTFVRREQVEVEPEVIRTHLKAFSIPFRLMGNRTEIIFEGADPVFREGLQADQHHRLVPYEKLVA